ncbi:unnamed protein product, partial [Mesorhabditis belari]|uniref:Flavin-containing monooxygenase n=1 Tax=Mesorhabditis belari TaxID=2138241 RepID=A0AAF3ENJ1_9BILA
MPLNTVGTEGTKQKRICVIGAGGSGLPCVRWAREYGADVTCFERSNGVGGLWHYKPNPTDLSNVMRGAVINTKRFQIHQQRAAQSHLADALQQDAREGSERALRS